MLTHWRTINLPELIKDICLCLRRDSDTRITDNDLPQLTGATNASGTIGTPGADYPYGPYVEGGLPNNPFNDLNTVAAGTGAAGDGTTGWQYDVNTGGIWPNHADWTP